MSDPETTPPAITQEQVLYYAGLWALKKLDVEPEDGGVKFPVILPPVWASLEPALDRLAVDGHVEIDRKKGRYVLTQSGLDLIAASIDEAEAFIDEFDDEDAADVVAALNKRNLDPLRVRFLWGWYQGEFDDPVLFQRRRGVDNVETDGAAYLMDSTFYRELARDLS